MTDGKNSPQIEFENTDELQPFANHSRVHSKRKLESLKDSLMLNGMKTPVLIDENKVIIDGHARWEVWRALGHQQIPTIAVIGGSELDNRLLRIQLAELSRQGNTDLATLRRELISLRNSNVDLKLTAIAPHILAKRIEIPSLTTRDTKRDVPSAPAVTSAGDHWRCAKSYLVCKAFSPAALDDIPMKGGAALIVCRAEATGPGEAAQDTASIIDLSVRLLHTDGFLKPDAHALVELDIAHLPDLLSLISGKFQLLDQCVRVPREAADTLLRSQDMKSLFVFCKKDGTSDASHQSVRKLSKTKSLPSGSSNTAALLQEAIYQFSQRGDTVLDLSLGSGASLLAAERTNRACVGFDSAPENIDASIRRWQRVTNRDAVHAASKLTFNEQMRSVSIIKHGATDV